MEKENKKIMTFLQTLLFHLNIKMPDSFNNHNLNLSRLFLSFYPDQHLCLLFSEAPFQLPQKPIPVAQTVFEFTKTTYFQIKKCNPCQHKVLLKTPHNDDLNVLFKVFHERGKKHFNSTDQIYPTSTLDVRNKGLDLFLNIFVSI